MHTSFLWLPLQKGERYITSYIPTYLPRCQFRQITKVICLIWVNKCPQCIVQIRNFKPDFTFQLGAVWSAKLLRSLTDKKSPAATADLAKDFLNQSLKPERERWDYFLVCVGKPNILYWSFFPWPLLVFFLCNWLGHVRESDKAATKPWSTQL